MIMKKEYIRPEMYIVILGDDILDVIGPGSPTLEPDAKENNIEFDWDDDESIFKDLWAEDEEEEKELW